MQYSILRVMSELKLLDSRISKKITNSVFITEKKKSAVKINNIVTTEEFNKDVEANYTSIVDLIERKKILKSLLVKSNAETMITVGGVTMTRADAIERKKSIVYEQQLLNAMINQYNAIIASNNRRNELMEQNLDEKIETMAGSDKNNKQSDGMTVFADAYRSQNGWEIIDPINLKAKIDKLREEIEDFINNINFVLAESNASTTVEVKE